MGAADVCRALGTNAESGLHEADASGRIAIVGPNELDERPPVPSWIMFLRQFASTMIVVLLIAAAITATIGDLKDTIVIVGVVVLNAAIGFVQEHRAEQAMAALRKLAAPFARVLRDGSIRSVPARELVPGDIVQLEAGDVVPADARLVEAPNLRVNEAALTGESVPVDKSTDPVDAGPDSLLADRVNMVFKGTAVPYGRAVAVVTATGMDTALGRIAGLLETHKRSATPLQRRLATLGRSIAVAAVAICALVFAVGVLSGEPATRMLLVSVSLAVAAIPESLPAVVTISLALGAQRMARHRAVVRRLPAVETLGSVTVIATDKTGTLTQGRMLVERIWTPDGQEWAVTGDGYSPDGDLEPIVSRQADEPEALSALARSAALCNDAALIPPNQRGGAWTVGGDPTEGALLALAAKLDGRHRTFQREYPRLAEEPFDSARKRMTTFHAMPSGGVLTLTKGALEAVAPTLVRSKDDRTVARLAEAKADEYAQAGYRVLALAGSEHGDLDTALRDANQAAVLYGLVALADPPRPEAAAAVAAAHRAGIRTVMITGDHPATARAIADRVGLCDGGTVMTGPELAAEGPQHLATHVNDVSVYARTTSEQKLDIVQAWKATGGIVAMTGDGVNDAPALRLADIGVAMGMSGTEVSKEAADMVLADDNFATIVAAVHEGRRIYDNVRRFVLYGLTGGSAEIWVMLAAPLFGLPLALLPAQILWINLLTHGLPGLALGVERAEPDTMDRPPRPPTENIFARGLWQHILAYGVLTAMVALGLGLWEHSTHGPWQTMLFTSLALLQLGDALAVRSERASTFTLGFTTNRFLLLALLGTLAAQLAAIYLAPFQGLLSTEPLAAADLLVVLAASSITFWAIEAEKLIGRRRHARRGTTH
jgi:ATPase, P-type (transporting), HAD superfamily, subfamily IC/ATPase, P-type (transporting), HAD superfamily, subfamily IC/ATPase, P-type (transporting), HAD superfamily, subfamily IC